MPNFKTRLHYFLISGALFITIFASLLWFMSQNNFAEASTQGGGWPWIPTTTDVQITMSVTPTSGPPGTAVTYTLTIRNNQAPTETNRLIISETLPSEIIITQIDTGGSFFTQSLTPTLSWLHFGLGKQDQLTITGIISPNLTNPVILTSTAAITLSHAPDLPIIFAGASGCSGNEVDINGDGDRFIGDIHTNGDVRIIGAGPGHVITGLVTYVAQSNISNTTITPTANNPSQVSHQDYPIDLEYADFVPGSDPSSNGEDGWAYTLINLTHPDAYHYYPGEINLSVLQTNGWINNNVIERGVYVTPQRFHLTGSTLYGDGITFVTLDEIYFASTGSYLRPYFKNILFLTNGNGDPCNSNSVIDISGAVSNIGGIFYAPNGSINISTNSNTSLISSLIAGKIDFPATDTTLYAQSLFNQTDINIFNNTDESAFEVIVPQPPTFDLEITKSVTPTTGLPGTAVTYTITISNNGPHPANDLLITDTLPAEFILSHVDTGGTFITQTITPTLSWSYPTLNPGAADSLTLTGIISPTNLNNLTITNTAVISQSLNRPMPVVMAGATSCSGYEVDINGSTLDFLGNIHSNEDVQITGGGQGNYVTGFVTYLGNVNIGPVTILTPTMNNPSQVAQRYYPIAYEYADFIAPDGYIYQQIMASNPGHYHFYNGEITRSVLEAQGWFSSPILEEGVYVTPVGFDLTDFPGNGLISSGATFVTLNEIAGFQNSYVELQPYWENLLLFSEGFGDPCSNNATLNLTGSGIYLAGTIFVPNGSIYLTTSNDAYLDVSIIGGKVNISGSSGFFVANQNGKPVEEVFSNNTAVATFTLIPPYPTAVPGGPYLVDEGSTILLDASASTGLNLTNYDWDLDNDGQYDDASGQTITFTNTADDATYPIGLRVTNSYNLTDTATTTVTVQNVAPTVTVGPDQYVYVNTAVQLTGTFTDPSPLDTHTITWDFGDGTIMTNTLTTTHTYTTPGPYTATLTITDDDGGTGSASLLITVTPYTIYLPTITNPNPTPPLHNSLFSIHYSLLLLLLIAYKRQT